ncbi:hypothetical protein CCYA_CCYA04G1235 [Cyanidiococcus yangmingshanensis]|nr:hypothetical protein CCYA_CCYA04G1235 [Cyanidiococcus yangmingshanensis]
MVSLHLRRCTLLTFAPPNAAVIVCHPGSRAAPVCGTSFRVSTSGRLHERGLSNSSLLRGSQLQKVSFRIPLTCHHEKSTAEVSSDVQRWKVWQRLTYLTKPYHKELLLAGFFTVASSLFLLSLVRLFGSLTSAVAAGSLGAVGQLASFCSLALMLRVAAQFGQDVLLGRTCTAIEDNIRTHYVASAIAYGFGQERLESGEASIQATVEIERIGNAILLFLRSIIPSFLQFLVMLGYIVYVSPLLTLCILLTAPLMAFVYATLERRLDQSIRVMQKLFARYAAFVSDSFRNRLLLQLYLAQEFALSRLRSVAMDVRHAKIRMHTLRASIVPAVSICYAITILSMLYVSAVCISRGYLEPKELVSFLAAVAFLIEPVQGIASGLGNIKEGEESARRVFRTIEGSPGICLGKQKLQLRKSVASRIDLMNVWFRYAADADYVLRGVTMTVKPGERIAIVGGSGAGKSTLIALLSRLCDPEKGNIYLDGVDLRELPLAEVRQRICVVPQDAPMLNCSVRENVTFGLPTDDEKIEQSCRLANAHDFIVSTLPNAYDTEVGEGGSNLSGGQRQRVAISRALYRDPGVLILDEAYSALDAESESLVQTALRELFECSPCPRTTIFIAHRLASVRYADRIIVMENGQIVEDGTHEELVRTANSRYGMLLSMQQRKP